MTKVYTSKKTDAEIKKGIKKGMIILQIIPISILIVTYLISLLESKKSTKVDVFDALIFMAILMFAITLFLAPKFMRIPKSLEISEESKLLKVEYFNGYGNVKFDVIDLHIAQVTYLPPYKHPYKDKLLKIWADTLVKWINVSVTNGFSKDELLEIYNKIQVLKT